MNFRLAASKNIECGLWYSDLRCISFSYMHADAGAYLCLPLQLLLINSQELWLFA